MGMVLVTQPVTVTMRLTTNAHAATDHAHGKHDDHGRDDHEHGHAEPPLPPGPADMNLREFFALAPLIVFVFWIGLCPQHFTKPMESVWQMSSQAAAAKVRTLR